MTLAGTLNGAVASRYVHCALLYQTRDELIDALVVFVNQGIEADEHVLVVVDCDKGRALLERLGSGAGFDLADSADVYNSPTKTLAAYIDAVRDSTSDGRAMRVAGEPIWNGLGAVEIAEWSCVEAACNVAFADSMLTMLCPYDVSMLDPEIIDGARRTHPNVRCDDRTAASAEFMDPHQFHSTVRHMQLPSPGGPFSECIVASLAELWRARSLIEALAEIHALRRERTRDMFSAIGDVVWGALQRDSGPLTVRLWLVGEELICDVSGRWTAVPFAGFIQHPSERLGTAGLWASGQLCDLMAVREDDGITTVRLKVSAEPMSVNPSCLEFAEFVGVYALDACEPDEVVMIEGHLAECSTCRDEVEKFAVVVAAMQADRAANIQSWRWPDPDGNPGAT